jgi:hypothetical protein
MGGFAGWSLIGSATSMGSFYGQTIILNMFFGTLVNAAQAIAIQISGQLGVFSLTLLKAVNPLIDKSEGAGNRVKMMKVVFLNTKISFFLLSFCTVPFIIETPFILKYWLKNLPEYSIIFCRLILIQKLIEQLFYTLHSSLTAVGNIRSFQFYYSILNIFPIGLSYILFLNSFPPSGIYISFILSAFGHLLLAIYFAKTMCEMNISNFLSHVIFTCLTSICLIFCFAIIPYIFLEEGILRFNLVLIISIVSFIFIIWNVGFSKIERSDFLLVAISLIDKFKKHPTFKNIP